MNQSSDPVQPLNAFAEEYLTLLREREEVPTAFEAERAGPWKIVKTAEGLASSGSGRARRRASRRRLYSRTVPRRCSFWRYGPSPAAPRSTGP